MASDDNNPLVTDEIRIKSASHRIREGIEDLLELGFTYDEIVDECMAHLPEENDPQRPEAS
jgi:hypothetical protein